MYRRPDFAPQVFRADDGAVIPYGHRWGAGSPPEDTYSVMRHPERFEPLLSVGEALISHLTSTFDVDARDVPGDQGAPPPAVTAVRTASLVPNDPATAPLTIAFTTLPGLVVRAGFGAWCGAPTCGCDACDESVEGCADAVETFVFAVVEERLQEFVEGDVVGWRRTTADGSFAESSSTMENARWRADVSAHLARHPDGWRPWPARG